MTAAPVQPVQPMLARPLGNTVPETGPKGQQLWFEPKWDGFRCLLFVSKPAPGSADTDVVVQSRSGEDLAYCFPEVVRAAREVIPPGTVLDGELVIAEQGRLRFDLLGQRIRPRSEAGGWKITELASEHPAQFIAFDLLAVGGESLMATPYGQRRSHLEQLPLQPLFHRTPVTADPVVAQRWFESFEGAGLDGVIAKPVDGLYEPGKRAMFKIKHSRTADVVVAGWRAHKQSGPDGQPVVGSLLLGLYDDAGILHHLGVAASFTARRRVELTEQLQPYAIGPDDSHPWHQHPAADRSPAATRQPGTSSRWSGGKDLSFHPLRPQLVAEVRYDHMEGDRLRHVAKLLRFRPDRDPTSCTYDQLETPATFALANVIPDLAGS